MCTKRMQRMPEATHTTEKITAPAATSNVITEPRNMIQKNDRVKSERTVIHKSHAKGSYLR